MPSASVLSVRSGFVESVTPSKWMLVWNSPDPLGVSVTKPPWSGTVASLVPWLSALPHSLPGLPSASFLTHTAMSLSARPGPVITMS